MSWWIFLITLKHYNQSSPNNIMLIPYMCPTEPTFDPSIANCDFESGLCLYTQDQVMGSWRRVSVKPNIFRNGDHTTGAGGIKRLRMEFITCLIFKPA